MPTAGSSWTRRWSRWDTRWLALPLAEIGSTTAAKATAVSERAPVLLSRRALEAPSERLVGRRVAGLRFLRRFVLLHAGEESLPSVACALYRLLREAARPSS